MRDKRFSAFCGQIKSPPDMGGLSCFLYFPRFQGWACPNFGHCRGYLQTLSVLSHAKCSQRSALRTLAGHLLVSL